MAEEIFVSPKKKGKIAVFVSGRGSNFRAILEAADSGRVKASVAFVFSNVESAPGLLFARERGLESLYLNPKLFAVREEYDKEAIRQVRKRDIDLVCLAGYMRILTPLFCREFKNRCMNIHPALLPSFPGLHVQQKAIDWGVKYSGATVHCVAEEVDMGPIIMSFSFCRIVVSVACGAMSGSPSQRKTLRTAPQVSAAACQYL